MLRGLVVGLVTFVVLVVLLGLLGNVGPIELGLAMLVAAVVGRLGVRRHRSRAQV
jgi:hypothetical protein